MAQDFLGSVAQEDVVFTTTLEYTSNPGDNYYKLLVFVEGNVDPATGEVVSGRFLADASGFGPAYSGSSTQLATVYPDTYATVTKGLLKTWLADFYANNAQQAVYLVAFTDDILNPLDLSVAIPALNAAYDDIKDFAYHKTICAGEDTALLPELAVALAEKCAEDKALLSAAPYYPLTTSTPEDYQLDPIYAALYAADATFAKTDAFMAAYQVPTRNAALYSLGIALGILNSTGTPVGNSIDYVATSGIGSSGPQGSRLPRSTRDKLKAAYIQFFKPVGDSTGLVDGIGVQTLSGTYMQAVWIVNYINFMSKSLVANFISKPNMMRNADTYSGILRILDGQLRRFSSQGSGRLVNVVISAPPFAELPAAAGDEIIVPNAWKGYYLNQLHKVQVSGTLVISA